MKSIEKDMEKWLEEREKLLQDNPFDETIANAMANSNVEMTVNKNKSMKQEKYNDGLVHNKLGMGNVRILYIRKNRKIITK